MSTVTLRKICWGLPIVLWLTVTAGHPIGRGAAHPPVPLPGYRSPTVPAPAISEGREDAWAILRRRPLRLPTVQPGSLCPTSPTHPLDKANPRDGWLLGDGLAAPLFPDDSAVMWFLYPIPEWSEDYGSKWSGQKVPWLVAPTYRGPLLIRGHQLDGPHGLRFGDGIKPQPELRIDTRTPSRIVTSSGWYGYPAATRVRAAGCYGYQVDGLGLQEVIVFDAVRRSAAEPPLVWLPADPQSPRAASV